MSGPIPNAPRVPAHDLDAEQATLACCLLSAAAIAECRELVGPGDFYKPSHAHVFTAICTLDDRGEPADPVTVHTELVRLGTAEGVTVPDLLALDAPATTSAPHYAATVAELARKRRLAGAGMETTAAALDPTRSSSRVLEEAEGRLIHAHGESEPAGRYSTGEVADRVLARIEALAERGGGLSGLPTGFTDLDHLLGGVEPGSLVVVGARPSMGKTGFGLCVARAAAARGTPALYTSAEMSEGEIMARLLGIMSGVGTHRQRSADLRPEEWMRLLDARKLLDSMPLEIDDRAAPTVSDIRLRARRMQVRSGLGLVVVDYLGLLSAPKAERRELEVAAIARGLKQIARSLGIVVVALSQLNRGLEARTDKRPLLSDLRESGAIEQDADVVAFIYRDEAYHPDSIDRGTAEIHVAKHRSGPTGVARLAWLPAVAKFADLDDRYVLR